MKPRKSIKPPPTNEPGGGVDALKVPDDDDSTPNTASPVTPSTANKGKTTKSTKPGNAKGETTLAQIPPGLGGSEIPQGLAGAASSTSLFKKKKKKKPKGTGSKSESTSSVIKKGSSIVTVGNAASLNTLGNTRQSLRPSGAQGQPAMAGSVKQKLKTILNFGPTRVSDLENQEEDEGEAVPFCCCDKKKLMISLIALILLILIIVIIAVLARPKAGGGQGSGSNNMTTPTVITSAPTTMYTPIPKCTQLNLTFPGVSEPTKLGDYCKLCFNKPLECADDCCGVYYASDGRQFFQCRKLCR